MRVVKGMGSGVLAFLLCLVLTLGFYIILVSNTILNKEYMLQQLSKNEFYEKIEIDLKNGLEEYQYQSGFSSEVFDELYSSEMIKSDVNSVIHYLYEGGEIAHHSQEVKQRIGENINQFLNENNMVLSEQQQQNVNEFEEIIVNVYEDKVNILSNYMNQIITIRENIATILKIAQKACIGALIVILLVIGLIYCKEIVRGINVVGIGWLSSGILLELVNLVITKNIDIENILLLSQSLSDLLKEIVYDLLLKNCWFGILFIVLGMVMIIMSHYNQINKK